MGQLERLSNGVRLYVDPMSGLESAAIGIWAGAGAIDETPPENGVAHLLEHMAFKGTSNRTARQISEEIESVGGYLNAATSYQRTGYYARVLKNDLELAVDILADILTNPLFEENELRKEQEVVVQEIGEAWDTPDDAVMQLLQSVAFKDQPLGRPILGSVESVRSFTPAKLRNFMDRRYALEGMVVAAAGAVDGVAIAQWIEGRMARGGKPIPSEGRRSPRYVGGCAGDQRDNEQTHIALGFPAVGSRHEDFFATRVFAEALGGGMSSRLFQTIREDKGLAYSVYAYADCYDEVGMLGAYAGTDADKAEYATSLIRQEIENLAQQVNPTEVDRARAMLKASLLMGLETPSGRTEAAASQIYTFGAPIPTETIRRRLDEVTIEDVRRCATRALDAGPPSLAVVGAAEIEGLAKAVGANL